MFIFHLFTYTYRHSFEFPAVTVCNLNMLRKSKVKDSIYKSLVEVDDSKLCKFCCINGPSCFAFNPSWNTTCKCPPQKSPSGEVIVVTGIQRFA